MTKAAKKAPAKKASAKKSKEVVAPTFNPYSALDVQLDGLEKKFGLSSMAVSESEDRLSTGLLTVDLILAGGMLPGGWYTFFGGEQSCKTTLATTAIGSIATDSQFRGASSIFDYEGSFAADYAENIFKYMNRGKPLSVDSVFGIRENDEWVIPPRVRYFSAAVGEDFYNYVAALQKMLPDVVQEDGKFYYVYENTRENQKDLKGEYDKEYLRKANKFRVPAPNGMPQAVILVDSYPAMVPKQADDKAEGDKSLALVARMHAANIPRIKGAMRAKRIIILGINQLRTNPGQMFGNPETEPGGQALKFFSDCRLRMSSVAIPHGKGQYEEEPAITGDGNDKYRYLKCKTIKNKLGGPQAAEVSLRIRVSDSEGVSTGFCRAWDAFHYLKMTGQIGGNRKKIKFLSGPFEGKSVSWIEFKALIDGDAPMLRKGCDVLGVKPTRLYEWCRKQLKAGEGYAKYLKSSHATKLMPTSADSDDDE